MNENYIVCLKIREIDEESALNIWIYGIDVKTDFYVMAEGISSQLRHRIPPAPTTNQLVATDYSGCFLK